jgi:hypothetical protein
MILGLEALLERVEWTRPDVAVNDTESNKSQLSEPHSCRMRLRMVENRGVLLKTFCRQESMELLEFLQ